MKDPSSVDVVTVTANGNLITFTQLKTCRTQIGNIAKKVHQYFFHILVVIPLATLQRGKTSGRSVCIKITRRGLLEWGVNNVSKVKGFIEWRLPSRRIRTKTGSPDVLSLCFDS